MGNVICRIYFPGHISLSFCIKQLNNWDNVGFVSKQNYNLANGYFCVGGFHSGYQGERYCSIFARLLATQPRRLAASLPFTCTCTKSKTVNFNNQYQFLLYTLLEPNESTIYEMPNTLKFNKDKTFVKVILSICFQTQQEQNKRIAYVTLSLN